MFNIIRSYWNYHDHIFRIVTVDRNTIKTIANVYAKISQTKWIVLRWAIGIGIRLLVLAIVSEALLAALERRLMSKLAIANKGNSCGSWDEILCRLTVSFWWFFFLWISTVRMLFFDGVVSDCEWRLRIEKLLSIIYLFIDV